MTVPDLPAPLVPPEVDLRDLPIPRDFFAHLAVQTFGISYDAACRFVDRGTARITKSKRRKSVKGRRH